MEYLILNLYIYTDFNLTIANNIDLIINIF